MVSKWTSTLSGPQRLSTLKQREHAREREREREQAREGETEDYGLGYGVYDSWFRV